MRLSVCFAHPYTSSPTLRRPHFVGHTSSIAIEGIGAYVSSRTGLLTQNRSEFSTVFPELQIKMPARGLRKFATGGFAILLATESQHYSLGTPTDCKDCFMVINPVTFSCQCTSLTVHKNTLTTKLRSLSVGTNSLQYSDQRTHTPNCQRNISRCVADFKRRAPYFNKISILQGRTVIGEAFDVLI